MNRKLFFSFFISLFLFTGLHADNTLYIIKVNGAYGIINKGTNQGMREGEIFYLKREGNLETICKVRILRTTANRSAIEQISNKNSAQLLKGDRLFLERELKQPGLETAGATRAETNLPQKTETTHQPAKQRQVYTKRQDRNSTESDGKYDEPSDGNNLNISKTGSSSFRNYSPMRHFKNPWVTVEVGSIFPNGHFSELYSNSMQLNANYMVSVTDDFNLGLDISNTFLNNTDLTASFESSSMLTVAVLFQKFFGDYFFMEGGGGVFRPKVTLVSVDNVKSSYSETNFGIIAGGGFFIPTSRFAGFTMKGKLHSYFDHYSKNYFGITGGFRFKIR